MAVTTTTHLNFDGVARAALEFYHSVFGGELTVMTYAEAGTAPDVAAPDSVIWGQVAAESGFRVMAYDVQAERTFARGDDSFFVSVRGTDADELSHIWAALAEGAAVRQPLGVSQWSPLYGMLTDRFGITWVIDLEVAWS